MRKDSKPAYARKWFDSGHASLCLLGEHLRRTGFFWPLEEGIQLHQKVRQYTPVQKLEMVFVSLLAGAKTVYQTGTTLRVDPALQAAFGLPGCAEQSVLADTLDAATEADVAALRQVVEASFLQYSQARQHDCTRAVLVLDVDLSPLPTSKHAEGATRGYMGRCRSKTGRKLVRVRAAESQETIWEEVLPGNTVETLAVVQQAVAATERLLDGADDSATTRAKRARIEFRLDSGWGSEEIINWLLGRGYQVTGKFKSTARVQKLVRLITVWEPTASPGREVAGVPEPVALARPCAQYAVRTPSKERASGYYQTVLFSSRLDLGMHALVDHYDGRAGMEADLKGDKRGLGLGGLRKHKLAAQRMLVLLGQWAHNVLLWARRWLARGAPRLAGCGIVRLVQEVWAVPGRVKLTDGQVRRVQLRPEHPRARDLCSALRPLLAPGQTLALLG
jgi:Transposase DDE domain